MRGLGRRRRAGGRRGVTPIIATILLVAITVVMAGVLYSILRVPLPPQPPSLGYMISGPVGTPVYGDGSDCTNSGGQQNCALLPAVTLTMTVIGSGSSGSQFPLANLYFYFFCNGTVYLKGTLNQIEVVPGSTGMPGPNSPQLGKCGTYTPPNAAFNRLVYFVQITPGDPQLSVGDSLVFFTHSFTCTKAPCDDDYHGAPGGCFSTPAVSNCNMEIIATGIWGSQIVATINLSSDWNVGGNWPECIPGSNGGPGGPGGC